MRGFCYQAGLLKSPPSDYADKARQISEMDAQLCKCNRIRKENRIERVGRLLAEQYGKDYCRAWEYLPKLSAAPFTEQTFLKLHSLLMPDKPFGYKKKDNLILISKNGIVKCTQSALLRLLKACFSGFEPITVLWTVIEYTLIIGYCKILQIMVEYVQMFRRNCYEFFCSRRRKART